MNVRPSVRTDYGGGESRSNPNGGAEEFHPFLTELKKRKLIPVCCQQTIAEVDLTFSR